MEFKFIDALHCIFISFQRNNAEHASKGPCRPGFSQSFYSVLISRDVLQGQGIVKGKPFNWQVRSFPLCHEYLLLRVKYLNLGRKPGKGIQRCVSFQRRDV